MDKKNIQSLKGLQEFTLWKQNSIRKTHTVEGNFQAKRKVTIPFKTTWKLFFLNTHIGKWFSFAGQPRRDGLRLQRGVPDGLHRRGPRQRVLQRGRVRGRILVWRGFGRFFGKLGGHSFNFFRQGTSPARSTAAPWTETCSGSTSSCRWVEKIKQIKQH